MSEDEPLQPPGAPSGPAPTGAGTPARRRFHVPAAAATTRVRQEPEPGMELGGRYVLESELGRGGMGVVYRAMDRELGVAVAVKLLSPELAASKRAVEDLKREAVLAMRLHHPGICALHNFAADEDLKYLVLELLEGCTLTHRLDELCPLPLEEVLAIARQVGEALDHAHEQRVVHRDIKPDNIFLRRADGVQRACLTDFGIARQMKEALSRLTQQDASGTLLYMSPEQLRGKTVDARADVYSLAATLYECLCGHPPFHQGAIAEQIAKEPPEPIAGLPAAVNAALVRALAKEPAERFPTCAAFLAALEGKPQPALAVTVAPVAPTAPSIPQAAPAATSTSASVAGPAVVTANVMAPEVKRVLGFLVDVFVSLGAAVLVGLVVGVLSVPLTRIAVHLTLAASWLLRDVFPGGRSPGKLLVRSRLVGPDGRPAGPLRRMARNFVFAVFPALTALWFVLVDQGTADCSSLAAFVSVLRWIPLLTILLAEIPPVLWGDGRRGGDRLAGTWAVQA